MKNIMAMALSETTNTPYQRASWLVDAASGDQLQHTHDQRDPAPEAQVTPDVVFAPATNTCALATAAMP